MLANVGATVTAADFGGLVTVAIDTYVEVSPTEAIQVELDLGPFSTFGFVPGGNDGGQSAPPFILAPEGCSIAVFLSYPSVGLPQTHIIIDVQTSAATTDAPTRSPSPPIICDETGVSTKI